MKTMNCTLVFGLIVTTLITGCGKPETSPIAEVVKSSSETSTQTPTVEEATLVRAYNLIDNTTPSEFVCKDMMRSFIDASAARARAVREQTARIKEICKGAPAQQGNTSVKLECNEVSGGDYVPQAVASTPYRCK